MKKFKSVFELCFSMQYPDSILGNNTPAKSRFLNLDLKHHAVPLTGVLLAGASIFVQIKRCNIWNNFICTFKPVYSYTTSTPLKSPIAVDYRHKRVG